MTHLTAKEIEALQLFKKKVQAAFPDKIDNIKLFGSKARGEAVKHSDVDVAVIMKEKNRNDYWTIYQAASAASLATDVDLSVKILSTDSVNRMRENQSLFIANIDREGVAIF